MRYVKAEEAKNREDVIYINDQGGRDVWSGGSRSWRNNNPGNLRNNGTVATYGLAIGTAGRFAVFPDAQTGRKAQAQLLREDFYASLTLLKGLAKYHGTKTSADEAYAREVAGYAGLPVERTIGSLNGGEFERLLDAIKRAEGWNPNGKVKPMKRVVATKYKPKTKTLNEFQIEGSSSFISLSQAIQMAERQEILAVEVGGKYIRSFPNSAEDFEDLVVKNS
jgi:hypothetical protein